MTLDIDTQALLDQMADAGVVPYEQMESVEQARAAFRKVAMERAGTSPPGPACSVEDVTAEGLWMRIYRPLDRSVFDGPLPLVLFFHGGGWVLGDLDTHDVQARAFAALPAIVVSVGYRLAPEHPYPAAHDDAWTALTWAAGELGTGFHADRLVVAGDSAGGLLAAAVAARAKAEGGPEVAAQCLVYPAMEPAMDAASHHELADGYYLTAATMRWFYEQYAPSAGFSPAERDDLSGLPPAVIATAGYDLLSDDGLRYADRLRKAGVPTVGLHLDGLIHGFFGMAGTSRAAAGAVRAVVAAVGGLLAA